MADQPNDDPQNATPDQQGESVPPEELPPPLEPQDIRSGPEPDSGSVRPTD